MSAPLRYVLALAMLVVAPLSGTFAQGSSPSPDAGARVRVDTLRVVVPLDSVGFRRAIDSAVRRALDSAARPARDSLDAQATEEQRQWSKVITALIVVGAAFLLMLLWDMRRGNDIAVETHWGGFGGGAGGTRVSRSLVLTVLLLLTGGMLTVLAVSRPGRSDQTTRRDKGADSSATKTAAPATSTSATPPAPKIPDSAPTAGATGR